jgi:hypothetical protein
MWSLAVHHHGDYGAVYGVSTRVSTQHSRLFHKIELFFTPPWSASHQQYPVPSQRSCDWDLSGHQGRLEFAYFYNTETKKTNKTKRQSTKKKLKKGTKKYEKERK